MKNIKKLALLVLLIPSLLFVSCEADSDMLTQNANLGGELKLKKEAITYVVGDGQDKNYDNVITIYQGNEKVQKIDIFKTFTTVKLGADGLILKDKKGKDSIVFVTSNKLPFKTLIYPAVAQNEVSGVSATFNELRTDLIVDGRTITTNDANLRIGDFFTLIYVSTLNNGKVHEYSGKTKISVGTRFAGTYKVIEGNWWRIGVPRPDIVWVGEERIIESVDATTYRFLEFAAHLGPKNNGGIDNTHYFTIDGLGNVRTPVLYNGAVQIIQGFPAINCEETPSSMVNACSFPGLQNTVVKDNVNGRDRIYRSYGWANTTGAREVYEVLEKIVD